MTNKEKLYNFVQQGVAELEEYLLSDILYWPLDAPGGDQRFTLGGMLLGIMQIQAMEDIPGRTKDIFTLRVSIDRVKGKFRAAWEKKARQETTARIRLWKTFLEEYRQNPEEMAAYYPREVKWRVLAHLLGKEIPFQREQTALLSELDIMVQSNWLPGDFIWEPYLVPAMPAPEYWFLYGKLKHRGAS